MGNLRKTAIFVIALLIIGLSITSCNRDPTEWLKEDSWAQSGPVCYSTPKNWSSNLPEAGSIWHEFMKSYNGFGMLSRIDPIESAELKIAMLQPAVNADNPDDPALGKFTELAAETLMADYSYLDPVSMIKTEVSGYPAYEIGYNGSNAGSNMEGRFTSIAGSTAMVIITFVAPAKEWDHYSPLHDKTKSNIYFAAEKDADGNCKLCLPYYR